MVANGIFFSYTHMYTPLKRNSTINTVNILINKTIGAISGSLTPYVGWAGAGGSLLSLEPFALSFYIFCWQYSHFYGILWMYKEDYKNAGFWNLIIDL